MTFFDTSKIKTLDENEVAIFESEAEPVDFSIR
jgi:hypothetical protein